MSDPYDYVKTALRKLCDDLRRNDPQLTKVDLTTDDFYVDDVQEYADHVLTNDGRTAAEAMDLSAALQGNTAVTSIVGLFIEVFMDWGNEWGLDASTRLEQFFRHSPSLQLVHLRGCPRYIYPCENAADMVGDMIKALGDNPHVQDVAISHGLNVPASAVDYLLRTSTSLHTLHADLDHDLIESQANPDFLAQAFGANTTLDWLSLDIGSNPVDVVTRIFAQLYSHPRLRRLTLEGVGMDESAVKLVKHSSIQELVLHVPCANAKRLVDAYCQRNTSLNTVLVKPALPCHAKVLTKSTRRCTLGKRTRHNLYPSLLVCAARPTTKRSAPNSVLLGLLSLGDSIDGADRHPHKKRRLDLEDTSDEE